MLCTCVLPHCHMWSARLYSNFPHYLMNGTIFGKLFNIKCASSFALQICLKHFSFWEEFSETWSPEYIVLHVKYTLYSSRFNKTCIFSKGFRKMLKYYISWQSVQLEPSCSMRTDGQKDKKKPIVAFHNFANAPENVWHEKTNSMEKSPSWEANSFSASQEIPRILWNPEGSLPHSQQPTLIPYENRLLSFRWQFPHQ